MIDVKDAFTVCGSGYPDMYWGSLITTLAGSIHQLKKIKGSSSYDAEDYGIALAEGHGAGLPVEEFEKQTAEGIALESCCLGYVCGSEDMDRNEWTLEGEPNTTIVVNRPATVELTCATLANCIPMLIDAPTGYITTEKMPVPHYLVKPMHEYVKSR